MAHKWSIYQIDVKNAFLHNDLRETIYMHQTPSFVDRRTPHYVCRLRKDLKETSKYMILAICDLFFTYEFIITKSDNSLLIYVNDSILVTFDPMLS